MMHFMLCVPYHEKEKAHEELVLIHLTDGETEVQSGDIEIQLA